MQYLLQMSPHNMANFGPLTAEIIWRVWGTTANFNGFRVLALLLQRRRSLEANQTLHDVWSSPELVHYVYIFRSSCPLTEVYHVQNSLCVLLYWQRYCTARLQRDQPNVAAWYKEWNFGTFADGATYIIGWAAITLDIGPHSSLLVC